MSSNRTDKGQSAYRFTAHLGAAVWFRQSSAGVSNRWRACQSVGGRANPSAGVPIGRRASQVAPLRFPGGGLFRQSVCGRANRSTGVTSGAPTFPGRRFVNRRGDIHVARVAGGNMRDRGGLVPPIGRRACQSVGRCIKPSAGVTSGAPTSPGRRFVNRRGDIHVARVAGGNMRDRGGLVPPIVGGRIKPSAGVSNRLRASQVAPLRFPGGGLVPSIGRRASQVAPLRFLGGGLVPSIVGGRIKPSTGVTSGAPAFPGRRFVNRRGDIHVARMAGGNMQERWIEASARGRQEYIK